MFRCAVKVTLVVSSFVISTVAFAVAGGKSAQCEAPWLNHGVYETTIVYGIDEIVPADEGPFLNMDPERNTVEYRQRAFDFINEHFGVQFDVNIDGQQLVSDDYGGSALMWPLKTGVGSTHQVYAIDAQNHPQWRSKMPLTQVAIRDDGYFVFVGEDGFTVKGIYGGDAGVVLPPGTIFLAGEYRMFDGNDQLIDTLRYFSRIPSFSVIDPGAANPTQLVTISCDIESDLFGNGQVRALGSLEALPDGSNYLDFRYVMRFPVRLTDTGLTNAKCDNIRQHK